LVSWTTRGRERENVSEGDHESRQEAKRRLSDPEGDHELHSAMERMKEHHPHLWNSLHRVHFARDIDPSELDAWRRAPEGSPENHTVNNYDRALGYPGGALQ
jgi:hypothetical protein